MNNDKRGQKSSYFISLDELALSVLVTEQMDLLTTSHFLWASCVPCKDCQEGLHTTLRHG